ncbi:MAG: NPCBM/NEW2 domain-containing protein [Oscillospiraceae bacterium]|nr:NPCBM/NEW2 domain-containing protein [Oscillospiraceae bacterium]
MKKKLAILVSVIMCLTLFSACGKTKETESATLMGKWIATFEVNSEMLEFWDDGTMLVSKVNKDTQALDTDTLKWVVQGSRIKCTFDYAGEVEDFIYEYKLSGKTLTLTDEESVTYTYKKADEVKNVAAALLEIANGATVAANNEQSPSKQNNAEPTTKRKPTQRQTQKATTEKVVEATTSLETTTAEITTLPVTTSLTPLDLMNSSSAIKYDNAMLRTFSDELTANDNTQFKKGFRFYVADDASCTTITYNLFQKYENITGYFYLPREYKNLEYKQYFKIIADGKTIYTSPALSAGVLPIYFDVDVSTANTIDFYMYDEGGVNYVILMNSNRWSHYFAEVYAYPKSSQGD